MRLISAVMKLLILIVVSVSGLELSAQNLESELQDYFYPFAKFTYVVTPKAENSKLTSTYRVEDGTILSKITETWSGPYAQKVAEEVHLVKMDESRRAIVSLLQASKDPMGKHRTSDEITMFILPKDSNPINWTETIKGEKVNCSAKYVYISFTYDGKKLYRKAVKIEKTTPLDDSSSVKEWSYWVKGMSRLATFGYLGNPENVRCIDKAVNLDRDTRINEISKMEYDNRR